ncbi:MAG: acetyl ornithine aminotransferase family protein [Planctomycetes bacterium]|nr:acetyl ornithine aminotransferase family protein [Planctomycetota bacterium]
MRRRAARVPGAEGNGNVTRYEPEIVVAPPGPKARKIIERDNKFITPAYTRSYPFVIDHGQGSFAWDVDGNRFIDFTAGVAVNAFGHAHPEIVRAVEEQARKFLHMAGTDFYYDVMAELAERLCAIAPGKSPKQCFLANSGTEAIEAAIKLARFATRRPRMIAFYNCFHGRSMGSLSLTASKAVHRRHFSPLLGDVSHAPYGDLDFIENILFKKTTPPEDVAAIFVEPIQGEGGYKVAPKEFLPGLRRLCDKHGILMVADEVQAGLGRTGKMNAVDHWGVVPDIICWAKPVGGGLPLGVMCARKDLHKWPSGAHANTFGGNALACAAGLKTLELIEREGLKNAREMGDVLIGKLNDLVARHSIVGERRGLALMSAVTIVKDKQTQAPDHDLRDTIVNRCFERGLLLLGCGENAIRFLPALNVERGHIDAALSILDDVLKDACRTA